MIFSIAMGAEYLSYVKYIATFAPTFYGYIISVLASVILTIPLANETNLFHLFPLVLHLPFLFKMELKQAKLSSMFMFTYYPDM